MNKPKLIVVAHTNLGTSLSGGDRIFLNILRYWQKHFDINFLSSQEAQQLTRHYQFKIKVSSTTATLPPPITLNTFNLFLHHSRRFFSGLYYSLTHQNTFRRTQYIYTSSDFYGDFVFGLIAKLVNPKITWLCGYYLLAPNPFDKNSPYIKNHQFVRGLIYYLAQRPTVLITKTLADHVFVTSNPDIKIFQNSRLSPDRIPVIQGGVYIPPFSTLKKLTPYTKRKYDAIYIGRLHSQKGVVEMIDIWQKVVNKLPNAKLAVIGDGELMSVMQDKIKQLKLENNIYMAGFGIGKKKFDLIRQSKIVLHPATHDSGGMAAAEAMAWGLPGVSYNLPALKTYYPEGMIKTKCFNKQQFASNIIELLLKQSYYKQQSILSRQLIIRSWNWRKRLDHIYQNL